jgi:hypothetical protein
MAEDGLDFHAQDSEPRALLSELTRILDPFWPHLS